MSPEGLVRKGFVQVSRNQQANNACGFVQYCWELSSLARAGTADASKAATSCQLQQ
jgi:hypothetical protein